MHRRWPSRCRLVVVSLVLGSGIAAAASTPAQKCAALKLKAAGKEVVGKMACHAKAKAKSVPVGSACLARAMAKADATIAKAGTSDCAGTAATIDAEVDSCVGVLVADVPGDGKCPSSSAKVVGTAGRGLLKCESNEVKRPGAVVECDARRDAQLNSALTAAGSCVSFAVVHPHVHACDARVKDVIPPRPGPVCGNGIIEAGEQCDGPGLGGCTAGLYGGCEACQCCIGEGETCGLNAPNCCGGAECHLIGPSIGICTTVCIASGGPCGLATSPCCGVPCPTDPGICP
jgi:hypothetical protein